MLKALESNRVEWRRCCEDESCMLNDGVASRMLVDKVHKEVSWVPVSVYLIPANHVVKVASGRCTLELPRRREIEAKYKRSLLCLEVLEQLSDHDLVCALQLFSRASLNLLLQHL